MNESDSPCALNQRRCARLKLSASRHIWTLTPLPYTHIFLLIKIIAILLFLLFYLPALCLVRRPPAGQVVWRRSWLRILQQVPLHICNFQPGQVLRISSFLVSWAPRPFYYSLLWVGVFHCFQHGLYGRRRYEQTNLMRIIRAFLGAGSIKLSWEFGQVALPKRLRSGKLRFKCKFKTIPVSQDS